MGAAGDMNRTVLTALALLGACRFDGGGLATDDAVDDDLDVDAGVAPDAAPDPGTPDAMPPPPPGTLIAKPAHGPVMLDGDDAEFAAAGANPVAWPIQQGAVYQTAALSYLPSAQVRVAAIHDAHAIYFFAEVVDAIQQFDSTTLWNDDGVTFYLDVLGDASGPFGADDHEIVVRGDGDWIDYDPVGGAATVTVARVATAGGYALEVKVTKASLGASVADAIGFDLLLTDDDGWGDGGYDALGVWFAAERPACATCCTTETRSMPWCDTTVYGTLRLE